MLATRCHASPVRRVANPCVKLTVATAAAAVTTTTTVATPAAAVAATTTTVAAAAAAVSVRLDSSVDHSLLIDWRKFRIEGGERDHLLYPSLNATYHFMCCFDCKRW